MLSVPTFWKPRGWNYKTQNSFSFTFYFPAFSRQAIREWKRVIFLPHLAPDCKVCKWKEGHGCRDWHGGRGRASRRLSGIRRSRWLPFLLLWMHSQKPLFPTSSWEKAWVQRAFGYARKESNGRLWFLNAGNFQITCHVGKRWSGCNG